MFDAELIYIANLFNERIYKNLNNILPDVMWESKIGKELFSKKNIDNFKKIVDADIPTLKVVLSEYMISSEIDAFIDEINESKKINDKNNIDLIVSQIFDFYRSKKLANILTEYQSIDEIDSIISEIKNIPTEPKGKFEIKKLSNLDFDKLKEDMNFKKYPSFLSQINDLLHNNAMLTGELVCVSGPPGGGKSIYLLQEAIHKAMHKVKVLMIYLSDLNELDLSTRFATVISRMSYRDVNTDVKKVFTSDKTYGDDKNANTILNHSKYLDYIIADANEMTIEDIADIASNDEYNIIIIDYDRNVKFDTDDKRGENMYLDSGELYNALKIIADGNKGKNKKKLIFVAAQPKERYYESEIIPLSGIGESSRKQQICDIIITISNIQNVRENVGYLNVVKARRGDRGLIPIIRDKSGRFSVTTKEDIDKLKTVNGENKKWK